MSAPPFATSGATKLEFWTTRCGKAHRLKTVAIPGERGTSREIALRHQSEAPRKAGWQWAVVRYVNGCSMSSKLLHRRHRGPLSARLLTNSNTYAAPNFNVDTSTNVAGLTALKGSAPDSADKMYVYNAATFTVEGALACLLISLGETSAGAATDGQRRGNITVDAGVTITFTGNATATNSGIKSDPASAPGTALESKSNTITINGTAANPVVMINSTGAFDAAKRFCLNIVYGTITSTNLTLSYPSQASAGTAVILPNSATYQTGTCSFDGTIWNTGNLAANCYLFGHSSAATISSNLSLGAGTINGAANTTANRVMILYVSGVSISQGSSATITQAGWMLIPGAAANSDFPLVRVLAAAGTNYYARAFALSQTDCRPTTTAPTGLAIADRGNGSGGLATISNIAAYANADEIVVTASDGTTVIGRATKTEYTANSGVICPNVTLGSARTGDKCFATSDLYVVSAFSGAAAEWTPTKRTVPAVAKVMADAGNFGDSGSELTPTLPLAKVHPDQGGTLDLPAITSVIEADTLETVAGTYHEATVAEVLAGVTFGPAEAYEGTFDPDAYAAIFEAARNEVPTLSLIPSEVNGGPAPWLQFNVEREGTGAGGGGTAPDAPSLGATPTAGDGQVILAVTAVNPTDVVYVLYRSGADGWSAESETFKRTGSGAVTVTGLTNEDGHEFVAYAKSGSLVSLFSDPVFATPSAGTTPAGLASLPLKYLRDTLAASAAFQGWVGAANPAEAAERIHPVSVATADALATVAAGAISAIELVAPGCGYTAAPTVTVLGNGTGASITAAVSGGKVTGFTIVDGGSGYTAGKTQLVVAGPPMPWALVDWAENFERTAIAGGSRRYFEQAGDMVAVLRAPVDADHDDAEAAYAFLNVVGAIIEDLEELSSSAGYLSINRIGRAQGPRRPEAAEVKTAGDYYELWLRIGWDGQ